MEGHWERDGDEFYDLDEMWDYIRDNEEYFDEVDFERWLNEHYLAAQIVWMSTDEDVEREGLWIWLQEEFENSMWAPDVQDALIEGQNYCYGPYGEFEFKWIDDIEGEE